MAIYWMLVLCVAPIYFVVTGYVVRINKNDMQKVLRNKDIKLYFVSVSIMMICIIGLRADNVGIDTINYKNSYINSYGQNVEAMVKENMTEYGFAYINIFFTRIGLEFWQFNILYAVFNVSVITYLIYTQSDIPWFSYFLYISFGFFILDLTMVRQTIAISIVIIAVLMNDESDSYIISFLKFGAIVYIASTIHSSAIIWISLWFIKRMPYNKLLIAVMLATAAAVYVFKDYFAQLVFDVAGKISEKYEETQGLGMDNAGTKLYLMMLVSVIFGLCFPKVLKEKKNLFAFYCMCIMLIIFPAVQGGGSIMRIYFYVYIFMIIYVPNMIAALDSKNNKLLQFVILVAFIVVGIYIFNQSLIENSLNPVPYRFFWQ